MLSEVPEGWEERSFAKTFKVKNNKEKQIKKQEYSEIGSYPIIDQSASFIAGYSEGVPNEEFPVVIFGDHTRAVKFVDFPFFAGADGTQALYPVEGIEPKFSYYLLSNAELPNLGYSRHMRELKRTQFPVPPLNEQHRISEILSNVDDSIQATQAVIEQAERVKRGLMDELLTGGLGGEVIERGEVPEGWSIQKLSELTTKIGSGVTPKGGRKAYVDSGFQLIRSQNVGWGEMMLDDVVFITSEQHEKMAGTKLKHDDVLLNITGASIGRSAIYRGDSEAANVNQHVCILRTNDVLTSVYLNAWLLSHAGQRTIDTFQAGGNRQGLNFQQIGSFPIPLPPLSEQQRIAEILSNVNNFIAKQKTIVEQQSVIKKGLMDDLLTGKVRPVE